MPVITIAFYTLVIDSLLSRRKDSQSSRGSTCKSKWKHRLQELSCGNLGLLLSSAPAYVITGALKKATGKPRPDLIDRCQPRPRRVDLLVLGLSNHSICTQINNAILKDRFRSFPSGLSSTSFARLFYLSLSLGEMMAIMPSVSKPTDLSVNDASSMQIEIPLKRLRTRGDGKTGIGHPRPKMKQKSMNCSRDMR